LGSAVAKSTISVNASAKMAQLSSGVCRHGQPFAQLRRHLLHVIFIQAQLLRDLSVREIQPHEIQA
jgi:hypothetical protein